MALIDGKGLAKRLRTELETDVSNLMSQGHRAPHLVAIIVGSDGASMTYVNSKERDCEIVGFRSTVHRLDESIGQNELLSLIISINDDPEIDGLIVQLPLPDHLDSEEITEAIDPSIDVDGFHTISVGKLTKGTDTFVSATPFGVMKMFEEYGIETSGKHCVVIGRSNIVGRPMSILMSSNKNPGNATVTLCHSRTKNLKEFTLNADIVIAALGIPNFVKSDMIKPGATVIDVGISRVDADNEKGYKLVGDVDFESVAERCQYITPVPGGVGPMTRYGLLHNTFKSYKKKLNL